MQITMPATPDDRQLPGCGGGGLVHIHRVLGILINNLVRARSSEIHHIAQSVLKEILFCFSVVRTEIVIKWDKFFKYKKTF